MKKLIYLDNAATTKTAHLAMTVQIGMMHTMTTTRMTRMSRRKLFSAEHL